MSSPINPADFMSLVGDYNENRTNDDQPRQMILATAYAYDNNLLKLVIDGESGPTTKGYSWVGIAPRIGYRVVLMPLGQTYVVLGELNSNTIAEINANVKMLPRGVVTRSRLTATSGYANTIGSSETNMLNGSVQHSVSADLDPNRLYRVGVQSLNLRSAGVAPARIGAALKAVVQNGAQANTKYLLDYIGTLANNTGSTDTVPLMEMFSPVELCSVQFQVSCFAISSVSGTYPTVAIAAGPNVPCTLVVEDVGVYI